MSSDRSQERYSALHNLESPASRLIRDAIWAREDDIGQQSFIGPGYLDGLIGRLGIGPENRVLDLGSGAGGPATYIAEATGCHLAGVEVNEVGVETARGLAAGAGLDERVSFHLGDAMAMPFDDGAFDVALSLNVLNVFEDKVALFTEVRRVLEPGGAWAFLSGTFQDLTAADRDGLTRRGTVPVFFDSIGGYRKKAEAAGFEIVEVTEYVSEFREQVGKWAAAYRRYAEEIAAEQGDEAAQLHLGYFDTYERLVAEGKAANHLVIATSPVSSQAR